METWWDRAAPELSRAFGGEWYAAKANNQACDHIAAAERHRQEGNMVGARYHAQEANKHLKEVREQQKWDEANEQKSWWNPFWGFKKKIYDGLLEGDYELPEDDPDVELRQRIEEAQIEFRHDIKADLQKSLIIGIVLGIIAVPTVYATYHYTGPWWGTGIVTGASLLVNYLGRRIGLWGG